MYASLSFTARTFVCFVLGVFGSYKKTSETLSTAGQRTSAAFSTLGSTITRKIGDMRYRLMVTCSLNFLLHTCQTALTVTVVVCKPCGHSHPMNLVVLWTHGVAFCDTRSANGFKHRFKCLKSSCLFSEASSPNSVLNVVLLQRNMC